MKKIVIVLIGLFFVGAIYGQSYDSYSYNTVSAADTILITYSDNIYGISIAVPADATDSTLIYGNARTLESGDVSQVSDGIILAPGEYHNISGNYPIRYLYIIVRDKTRIISRTVSKLR